MSRGNKRRKNLKIPSYPLTADGWRNAINEALNLATSEGKAWYEAGTFPFDRLKTWMRREFSAAKGYSPDFVRALLRNCKGLVAWAYGGGSEPYWPGQDEG